MAKPQYDHAWRKVRAVVLERDSHRCRVRLSGCLGAATEVDHVVSLEDGGARLDLANLRASCKPCNVARANQLRAERVRWARRVAASVGVGAGSRRSW